MYMMSSDPVWTRPKWDTWPKCIGSGLPTWVRSGVQNCHLDLTQTGHYTQSLFYYGNNVNQLDQPYRRCHWGWNWISNNTIKTHIQPISTMDDWKRTSSFDIQNQLNLTHHKIQPQNLPKKQPSRKIYMPWRNYRSWSQFYHLPHVNQFCNNGKFNTTVHFK